jgi:crotonobetainyl-CoA:carnitine CoA-transferase CaiB-like acyl-CoA transferase
MAGPLEGLVVVDTSWGMPGAIAGMLLADYGARVIKVERPGGGPETSDINRTILDRGKWSTVVDLESAVGRERVADLLGAADVFIESFGPDRAEKLGLGYADLHGRYPGLVYCGITGYPDGPWRDRPGYEALVAARLGLMAEQAGHRSGPKFLGHSTVSYCTAFTATIGVLAALHARYETGRGQKVDASLFDAALAQSSMNWWWNERDLSYLARNPNETGFGRNRIITDLFECADGEFIIVHTGGEGGFKRTMDLLGLGTGIRSIEGLEMAVPLDDEEYHAARELTPEAFKARPRDEWVEAFHRADLAALPVLRPEQALDDDQVQHAGVVVRSDRGGGGSLRQVGPVIRFAASPAAVPGRAPRLGEHDDEVLPRPSAPSAGGGAIEHALTGVRVVDFSAFFATAFGARLLSDLGADVIKVEPITGDQMRPLADLFEGAQRGKRTIALDLSRPAGREVAHRLVRDADVVMHNFRPGKAEKLGIGYDDVAALNPDVVYCYLPGFGSSGPKADLKSFAPLQSGFAGMLYIGAGAGNPPVRRVMGNEDLYNGLLGATAALMGLQYRNRTGHGQYIESPQLHSSLFVRTEQAADDAGRLVSDLVLDAEQTGWGPLYRLYRVSDGWVCLACVGGRARGRLQEALGVELPAEPDRLAAVIGERLGGMTGEAAQTLLDAHDVPCEIAIEAPLMPDFLWDQWAEDTDRVFAHEHPEHGMVREIGLIVRLSDTPGSNRGPSPRLGQHTREILAELAYPPAEVDAMVNDGVCRVATT